MRRNFIWILIAIIIGFAAFGYPYYRSIYLTNVSVTDEQSGEIFIKSGTTYDQLANMLVEKHLIQNPKDFDWVARRMNYPRHVYPGRYVISDGMNNRELIQMLRSGQQTPIKLTFVKFRTLDQLAKDVSSRFEMSEMQLKDALNDERILREYGLKPETVMGIFIPNTYEMYWTISPKDLIKRMYREYRTFWNDNRNTLREKLRLDRMEVMSLASIVEEETIKNAEKQRIAGVYLNRIRKRMLLQADPTVRFAVGDFSLRRILNEHLEIDSPYNTYRVAGIPPGPICTPSIPSIDAVLNSERHDYYYFCARADSTGLHHFSENLSEHLQYARAYHQELNRRGIK